MAIFVSNAPNCWISINLMGGHKTIRFNNGRLNTAIAAKKAGISEDDLIERLKDNRYYGVRFWEQEGIEGAAPQDEAEPVTKVDDGLPSYRELTARAQELGIPYVGVKHSVLAEQVAQAEALLVTGTGD